MKLEKIIEMIPNSELDEAIRLIGLRKGKRSSTTSDATGCPHCGSHSFIKYGKDSKGNQRYRCECGKTFTETTGSAFHHMRVDEARLRLFLDLEFSGMTLHELSHHTKLSVTTCHSLRRRLQRACFDYVESSTRLSGTVQVDASYAKINMKGTRPGNMPRISKKRGNGSEFSGISHHKVCIATAIDENDNCLMRVVGLGSESAEKYSEIVRFMKGAKVVVSDSKPSIRLLSNSIGAESDMIRTIPPKDGKTYVPQAVKRHMTDSGRHIQDLNELVKGIKDQTRFRHGMGTRYLNDWLAFICVRKMLGYRCERADIADRLLSILGSSNYKSSALIAVTPHPISLKQAYWDYHYGIFSIANNI